MHWIRRAQRNAEDLQAYVNELEKKHQLALNELANISSGLALTDQPDEWSTVTKLRNRAARFLSGYTRPLTKRPPYIF